MAAAKAVWRDGDGKVHCAERAAVQRLRAEGRWRGLTTARLQGLAWYAVMARPGHDRDVEAILERRGFIAVVPCWRRQRLANRHAKRKIEVLMPVAPGYVLVGFDAGQMMSAALPPWHRVFDLSMVASVVGLDDSGTAWRLNGQQVASFLRGSEAATEPVVIDAPELRADDMVQISDGPFRGHIAPVVRVSDAQTVTLLLALFGRFSEITLDRRNVEPVRGATGP